MSFADAVVTGAIRDLERAIDAALAAVGDREDGVPRHAVLMARDGLRCGLGEQAPGPLPARMPYMPSREPDASP